MLAVLKVILLVLLALIILFILLLCVFLFVPAKYVFSAVKEDGEPDIRLDASWLFGLAKIKYIGGAFSFRLLWLTNTRGEKKRRKKKKSIKPETHVNAKEDDNKTLAENGNGIISETSKQTKETVNKSVRKGNFRESLNKLGRFAKYKDKNEIIKHTLVLCGKWLKALNPKTRRISVEFGFEDPSNTGFLLGFLEILNGIAGAGIKMKGHFDETVFKYDVYIRDKLFLWQFLWPLLRFAVKKPIWEIIKKEFFERNDDNELIAEPKS